MSQEQRCRRFTPWGTPYREDRRDSSGEMRCRLLIAFALSVLAALAVGATLAVGNGTPSVIYGTRVVLEEDSPIFHGRVGSHRLSCQGHRKVRIVRFSTRHVIGVTTSNRSGKWKLLRPDVHGRFRARIGIGQNRVIRPGLTCSGGAFSHWIRVS